MKLTLLLDLDDTLIGNDIEVFLPQYIGAFQDEVASQIDPQKFAKALMTGTKQMVENLRPDCTLKEVFDASFFPELGIREQDFQPISERYYSQVFPTLKNLIQPRQEALELVETALSLSCRLAIATNPLFPLTANLQRLEWGGLSVDQYPFEIVSSYENFHFAKPNPAFFAEVLARIGWPDGPVVVVGDDFNRDIIAAHQLGVLAYWVNNNREDIPTEMRPTVKKGPLEEFFPWLVGLSEESMLPDYRSQSALLAILYATPAALDSICRKLTPDSMQKRPHQGEWSVTEILCHLRDVEKDVYYPRLKRGLQENAPFLVGENTDSWAEERNYFQQDGRIALQEFIQARLTLLSMIEDFKPNDWQRTVRHSIFGPTSLTELINIITRHDQLHVNQVHQVLSSLE